MDPSIPLHKQLSSKIGLILVLFSSIIAFLCYLLYARELDVDKFKMQIQPELKSYSELNRRAWQISADYSQLIASSNASEVLAFHRKIQSSILDIKNLSTIGRSELLQVDARLEHLYLSVIGLSENYERNALLKETALLQLRLALNELELLSNQRRPEAEKLYQQIVTDNVSDRVTVSRAKAYLLLSGELAELDAINQVLNNLLITFNGLGFQTPMSEFNYHSQQVELLLTKWLSRDKKDLTEADQKLLLIFSALNEMLFEDQRTIAKWRGHIRVANDYFDEMQKLHQNINDVVAKMKAADVELQNLPGVLNDIPYTSGKQSREMYYMSTLGLVAIFFLLGCLFAYRIYLSLKRQATSMRQVIESFSSNVLLDEHAIWNKELFELSEKIKKITHPEHSEADYQALANNSEQVAKSLFDIAHVASFTCSSFADFSGTNANSLLFTGAPKVKPHWNQAFDRKARKMLFNCLRQVLKKRESASCIVENLWATPLQVFLSLNDDKIQGVVIEQRLMTQQLQPLQHELQTIKESQQSCYRENLSQLKEINQAISRAMVQAQNPSKSFEDICQQTYRHQTKLLEWSEQALLVALANQPSTVNLLNANLLQLLQVCAYNTLASLKSQRLRVLFDIDQELKVNIKAAQPYFSYCLTKLMQIALTEQLAATLIVKVRVLDVNPGQQHIQVSLQIKQKYNKGVLPELVQLLVQPVNSDSPILIKSLFTGLEFVHGNVLSIDVNDEGYDVICQLPTAISERKLPTIISETDFAGQQIFVAGDKGYLTEFLAKEIKVNNGVVESFYSAEHLLKALHIKSLQALPVKAVVVTANLFKTDQDGIVQHIEGLPKAMRPKLFVLQSIFGKHLARQGVFSFPDSCFLNHEFSENLSNLLNSDEMSNQACAVKPYKEQQFRQSNIQLLLVINNLTSHNALIAQLHWLGLQVQVESDANTAQQLWSSGRYQVIMSNIDIDPFVDMTVGKPLYRGVFSLDKRFSLGHVPKHLAHWKVEQLANAMPIHKLIELLLPWLSKLPDTKVSLEAKVTSGKASLSAVIPAEKQLDTLELDPAHDITPDNKAFDLAGFAQNQGSAELAAFMLDEYLSEINDILSQLENRSVEQIDKSKSDLEELRCIALILTATNFQRAIESCQPAYDSKNAVAIEQSLAVLRTELELLQAYSLAI